MGMGRSIVKMEIFGMKGNGRMGKNTERGKSIGKMEIFGMKGNGRMGNFTGMGSSIMMEILIMKGSF